jgi:hypothetical protein
MTAEVANLLAEIRRSGGEVRLLGCDKLKLVAPAALLHELTERVRAAKPMLLAALAATGRKPGVTLKGGGGVINPWRNGATAQHPTTKLSSDRGIAMPAADWGTRYREALAYWSALHPAGKAGRLAWGEIENQWHMRNGERVPDWQCAGCRAPIGGLAALTLADGNRVHLDKLSCMLTFGQRWRRDAAAALSVLGLAPPPPPKSNPSISADRSG